MDIVSDWLCRLLNHMDGAGVDVATPLLLAPHGLVEDKPLELFSSNYIRRAGHLVPRSSTTAPWQLSMDYRSDRRELRDAPIDDGVMQFSKAHDRVDATLDTGPSPLCPPAGLP